MQAPSVFNRKHSSLKPEEWQDAEGVKHSRVILVATKFYEAEEKEKAPVSQRTKTKKNK